LRIGGDSGQNLRRVQAMKAHCQPVEHGAVAVLGENRESNQRRLGAGFLDAFQRQRKIALHARGRHALQPIVHPQKNNHGAGLARHRVAEQLLRPVGARLPRTAP